MIAENGKTFGNAATDHRYSANRICIVNSDGGAVTFALRATNSLQAEAAVHILPADEEITSLEYLKLDTKFNCEAPLQLDPLSLNKRRALIRFSAWSVHADHYSGKIAVDILQNNQRCLISKAAEWLRIVPKYGTCQAFEWITVIHLYCTPAKGV
jgi:hypothetical protein